MPQDWVVQAGGYQAYLLAADEIGDRVRSLLVDLRVSDASTAVGSIEVFPSGEGSYALRSDGRVWGDAILEPELADEVIRMLLQAALEEESAWVHIHAGAVTLGDRTAVLAGWPASGKSTAITALVGAGFGYVTDERLVLSEDGGSVCGFPKPISLISGSFDMLAHLDPQRTGYGASSGSTWQIPASVVGSVATQEFRAPSVLVFITYRSNASLRVVDVAPHTAAARLLEDSPDVIIRGREGAQSIVALASSILCVELEYSVTAEMVAAVRELLERARDFVPSPPIVARGTAVPDRHAPSTADGLATDVAYAIVEGVSTWVIGDHAVAYVQSSGEVVELDEVGATWLQLLDDTTTIDELINEVADATGADVGVVRSGACRTVHGLWSAGVIGPLEHPRCER